jgi:hypothetical protein
MEVRTEATVATVEAVRLEAVGRTEMAVAVKVAMAVAVKVAMAVAVTSVVAWIVTARWQRARPRWPL